MSEAASGGALAHGIELSQMLVKRYFAGFDDSNRTKQAPGLPNHFAWQLGHLALTMHRVAEKLDGGPLPATDFTPTDRGDARSFGTESVAFGSKPSDTPANYPSAARCVEIFDGSCSRLARALRAAGPEKLAQQHPWGATGATSSMHDLALRMLVHNGMHAGQLADLRRALSMGSIFK